MNNISNDFWLYSETIVPGIKNYVCRYFRRVFPKGGVATDERAHIEFRISKNIPV